MIRWVGAGLILLSCGGFGFSMAANHCREEKALKQLLQLLTFMECELQYRLSSLPELCAAAANTISGIVANVITAFSLELESQRYSDPAMCMDKVLSQNPAVPTKAKKLLSLLGRSVGKFDLDGQLKGLQNVKTQCADFLAGLSVDRDIRIRNYQTLGLCAGAALAILLL